MNPTTHHERWNDQAATTTQSATSRIEFGDKGDGEVQERPRITKQHQTDLGKSKKNNGSSSLNNLLKGIRRGIALEKTPTSEEQEHTQTEGNSSSTTSLVVNGSSSRQLLAKKSSFRTRRLSVEAFVDDDIYSPGGSVTFRKEEIVIHHDDDNNGEAEKSAKEDSTEPLREPPEDHLPVETMMSPEQATMATPNTSESTKINENEQEEEKHSVNRDDKDTDTNTIPSLVTENDDSHRLLQAKMGLRGSGNGGAIAGREFNARASMPARRMQRSHSPHASSFNARSSLPSSAAMRRSVSPRSAFQRSGSSRRVVTQRGSPQTTVEDLAAVAGTSSFRASIQSRRSLSPRSALQRGGSSRMSVEDAGAASSVRASIQARRSLSPRSASQRSSGTKSCFRHSFETYVDDDDDDDGRTLGSSNSFRDSFRESRRMRSDDHALREAKSSIRSFRSSLVTTESNNGNSMMIMDDDAVKDTYIYEEDMETGKVPEISASVEEDDEEDVEMMLSGSQATLTAQVVDEEGERKRYVDDLRRSIESEAVEASVVNVRKRQVILGSIFLLVLIAVVGAVVGVTASVVANSRKIVAEAGTVQGSDWILLANQLTLSNQTLSYPPRNGSKIPEELALAWLVEQENLTVPEESASEKFAFVVLSFALNYPTWRDATTIDCELKGVGCGPHGEVDYVYASKQNMTGSIPSDLALLSKLTHLTLSLNELNGTIPWNPMMNRMEDLEFLDLDYCMFSGPLPSPNGTWTKLEKFWLAENFITGTIPKGMSQWTSLQHLYIPENQLTGSFPSELAHLNQITWFSAYDNGFTGTLPTEFGLWTSLSWFEVSRNKLHSSFPSEISQWTNIIEFQPQRNNFSGSLPSGVGNWTKLKVFEVDYNRLSGSLPTEIGLWTLLTHLRVDNNLFQGTLPTEIGLWTNIEYVYMDGNDFTGTIPTEVINWKDAADGYFHQTRLEGTMPFCLQDDHSLFTLYADCCDISCPCCSKCIYGVEGANSNCTLLE